MRYAVSGALSHCQGGNFSLPATMGQLGRCQTNSLRRIAFSAEYAPIIALRIAGPFPVDRTAALFAGRPSQSLMPARCRQTDSRGKSGKPPPGFSGEQFLEGFGILGFSKQRLSYHCRVLCVVAEHSFSKEEAHPQFTLPEAFDSPRREIFSRKAERIADGGSDEYSFQAFSGGVSHNFAEDFRS